jgi:L-lysine exporter family protein LysE/ArgO
MLSGFALGGGLIVAIGAQNAYLLRMGLARQHVGLLAFTAALLDGLLIVAGLLGLGRLIQANPSLAQTMRWGGALFLLGYGLLAAWRAWQGGSLEAQGSAEAVSARAALGTLMGLSLLNPHVYLDTVVLVGAIGARHAGSAKAWFGLGAVTASVVWFFSLAYGARLLAPWLATRRAWQVLDGLIALTMLALAASLILG